MKMAILGFSRQGQSAYKYWANPENEITVCDLNENIQVPSGADKQLGENYLHGLARFDLLVRTPALHPRDIIAANPDSPGILDKVTSNTNEFFRVCPSKNIIGVTGTKGKGTTSTLISKILEASGKRVHLGGNIGIAPLEMLMENIQPSDWVVLELANFQLIDLKYSPPIAVCLMIEPEHLNWHTDMAEYIEAKSQIFVHQKANDIAIYYASNEDSHRAAAKSSGVLTPYMEAPGAYVKNDMLVIAGNQICNVNELKLLGRHNWQNVCAAITAVWQISQDIGAFRLAVTSFVGLPHRLEPLRVIMGVTYYNDSFATSPTATIAALDAITQQKVMIVGGFERGLPLDGWAQGFARHNADIRQVLAIGESRKRAAQALKEVGISRVETVDSKDIGEIVTLAQNVAQVGDAVVLSPGFASFDMFKDFEDRGVKYTQAVTAL